MEFDCVVFLRFLLSTLGAFTLAGAPDAFETPEFEVVLTVCFFFVPFVETIGAVSFVLEDLRRVTVGRTA